jgi:hypothetical protein
MASDTLLFSSTAAIPVSCDTFCTKTWILAMTAAEIDGNITFHNGTA